MRVIRASRLYLWHHGLRVLLTFLFLAGLTALVWAVASVPSAAQSDETTCGAIEYDTCLRMGTATVSGIPLGSHCLEWLGRRDCVDSAPLNECAALEVSLKCEIQTEQCVDWRHGECRQTRFVYECLNENDDMSPAHLVETVFGPVQEEIIDQCGDLENRVAAQECRYDRTDVIEGAEVRDINRKLFAREWWLQQRTFMCISDSLTDNTCGPLESDPACMLQGSTCLAFDQDGNCTDREFHYRCGAATEELGSSCEPINVCVGDTCLDVHQEENTSFGHSAAWLNVLAEMQTDFRSNPSSNPSDVQFFSGERLSCSKIVGRNCCSLSGILSDILGCPESAEYLKEKRIAGHTHYVGTSCQQRVLGACVKRRQHFCTYNSKFSRVFMEQYKLHAPEPWGHTLTADCTGVSIEDVANVDVEAMNFDEVVGQISNNLTITVSDEIADFFNDRWPSPDALAGDVFEEVGAD